MENNLNPQKFNGLGANAAAAAVDVGRDKPKENPLAAFFNKKEDYTSIVKSLETINIIPNVTKINGEDCLVIPLSELIYKEWQHMSAAILPTVNEGIDQ